MMGPKGMLIDKRSSNAVTVSLDEPDTYTQDPVPRKSSKKIYIPIHIQTNALNNDEIAINGTYISIEDISSAVKKSTRNRRDIEARYLESIKSLQKKFRLSYLCSPDQCPMMKQRLDQHKKKCHSTPIPPSSISREDRQSQTVAMSPATSILKRSPRFSASTSMPSPPITAESSSMQTNPRSTESQLFSTKSTQSCSMPTINKSTESYSMPTTHKTTGSQSIPTLQKTTESNLMKSPPKSTENYSSQTPSNTSQENFNIKTFRSDVQTQLNHKSIRQPNRIDNETIVTPKSRGFNANETTVTPKTSRPTYSANAGGSRAELNKEILRWFEDIPIYPNLTPSLKNFRRNMVNEFIEKISELVNKPDNREYEKRLHDEIDSFLKSVPMWYPGAKRDQYMMKENIKNNLLDKIKGIRDQSSTIRQIPIFVDNIVNTDDSFVGKTKEQAKEQLIESEVLDWLMQIKFKHNCDLGRTLNIIDATDILTKRLMPLLEKSSHSRNYKLVLKGLIVDTLNDLSKILYFPKNKSIYLNRISEDLVNRLTFVLSKFNKFGYSRCPRERSMYRLAVCSKTSLKQSILEDLNGCITDVDADQRDEIKEEITDLILDCIECLSSSDDMDDKDEHSVEIKDVQAPKITAESVRDILTEDIINHLYCTRSLERPCHSGTISVYISEHEISGPSKYPITSTPKKKPVAKEVSKLNAEEVDYMNKVSNLIRAWMETLPVKFDAPDEKGFKETVIKELAGEIMDQNKLVQLAPQLSSKREIWMQIFAYKWLFKIGVYEFYEDAEPAVEDFVQKLNDIPVPDLTKPQRGSRQAMTNIKYMESDLGWKVDYVPKGIDILEDEISIFMSELPSEVYVAKDKDHQNKMVHELASNVKTCLDNKKPESEITDEVSKWLNKMVKSPKKNVDKLTGELKDRILKLPQDATLAGNLERKLQLKKLGVVERANAEKLAAEKAAKEAAMPAPDTDRTLMEFIGKYMERNYNLDNSIARGAFGDLLKTEFRKLSPPTRKEVYDNFSKSKQHDEFSPERLGKELQYIKIISDWLKNIPIEGSFNTPNNKTRIGYVNDLAKNIYEAEESRRQSPLAMDYDVYLLSVICQSFYQLPILPGHEDNVGFMVQQLMQMIAENRAPLPCCTNANQTAVLANNSVIQEQDIGEFIDSYIRTNAGEIADDQVKLDAWSARLLKEVKKLARDTAHPSTLCKAQVYNKLSNVPIPEEESIRIFGLELDYAKEISNWISNLPLLPITSQEASDQRVTMISELAEKFANREKSKLKNPAETPSDSEMEEYVTNWIHRLPLDRNRQVDYPIAVKQLLNRIERVNKDSEESIKPQPSTSESNTSKKKVSKVKSKSKSSSSCCNSSRAGQSGQVMVEAIEKWSNKLPVKAENKDAEKTIKDDVARKLYQKAGELSVDPMIMKDDQLYQELFTNEVDAQLNNLKSPDVQKNKESLKKDLVDKVMEARNIVIASTAGENYKYQLENTIDASIPNPVYSRQQHDPGFEIYRNRLADMFILENFDHGNDAVRARYEKLINKEIDKHYQEALKRNAEPLSKEQIYSELYSALYKVPSPSKCLTNAEVEEVKTRCEIDDWFDSLPIQQARGPDELLERDKILSMLAKRLHEIEKNETKPDDKLHREITKWIVKFPLLPEQEGNIDKFADDLQNKLKASKEHRKCVPAPPLRKTSVKDSKKGKDKKKPPKSKGILGTSQVAGPSSAGQNWVSPPASPAGYQRVASPRKKAADIMLQIVENWCENLPMYAGTPQEEVIIRGLKEDLLTKVIIKICELNSNPETFSDDLLYSYLLAEELGKLMSQLPICCNLEAKQMELVGAIDAVKVLMREERARLEYVEELKNTVNSVLEEPLNTSADKHEMFNELRDEIVDDFVQYRYNRDDDEGKQIYKAKLRDAVNKYFIDINEKHKDTPVDPLVVHNQLLCELAKIPVPSEKAVEEEVDDIRMKNEVKEFFDEQAFPDEDKERMMIRNNMKHSLAKRLNEIEKTGHNCTNDDKMKKEISRCFKKLEKEVAPEKIEEFVDRLKANEGERKSLPAVSPTSAAGLNQSAIQAVNPASQINQLDIPEFAPRTSIQSQRSLGVTPVEYQGFGGGVVFSSSRQGVASLNRSLPVGSALNRPTRLNQTAPSLENPLQEGQFMLPNQGEPSDGNRRKRSDDDGIEDDCKCLSRMRRRLKGRPRCVLRRPDSCDECEGFGPIWPMHMPPPYRFPPYFYY